MNNLFFASIHDTILFCQKHPDQLVLLFAKHATFWDAVSNFPDNLIITSSDANISTSGRTTTGLSGFSISLMLAQVIPVSSLPMLQAQQLEDAYQQVKKNKNACLFLLCDGTKQTEEIFLNSLYFIDDAFKIIGGSAADAQAGETTIFFGQTKVDNLAIFLNIQRPTKLIKENLYQPTNKQLLVTHADMISRTVYTFNNQPAAIEYARQLNVSVQELANLFLSNPLGKNINGNFYIASPRNINKDMSITFYSQIVPNTFVDILELSALKEIIQTTQTTVKKQPSFIFSIHCILRDTYLNQTNQWPLIINNLNQISPHQTGFVSYGEQLFNLHLNQTMTLLVVE
ncbi:FIST signal transduction protein [Periweissella beninensis]|uniref:FIST signal transduction protein n=1 Tax=Periweissella beninensis TaxID=504936 RepID=UPI0021A498F1|nr:FIST C-terminal domain-containing protein [Periweissella beninensis]MCT4395934.1 FIST domain containing protein [Periweissella beninensis]